MENDLKTEDPTEEGQSQYKKMSKVKLERYKDPEGLGVKRMSFGLWYMENKYKLNSVVEVFLIGLSVLLWAYSLYGLAHYFLVGRQMDSQMIKELVETDIIEHGYFEGQIARDLITFTPQILASSEGKYDFVVQVRNPNTRHWGEFNYYLMVGNERLESSYSIIYPGEAKYFLSLSHELPGRPSNASFVVENVVWHRINKHDIGDWDEFYNEHVKIAIDDILFTPGSASGLSEKISLNNLEFNATNESPYSYWNVDFVILLYQRGLIVGVNKYNLRQFMSFETRSIRSSWPGVIGRVDNVEVMPYVNILDEANFIKPGAPGSGF